MPKRLTPETYKSVYSTVPRLCIDLVMVREDGILLIERAIDPGKGLWHMPGGTVLLGESLEQAMQRIAEEETGLQVQEHELVGMMEFSGKNNPFFHTVSAVFRIPVDQGDPRGSRQGKTMQFWTQLPENTIPEQKEFLRVHQLI